MKAATIVLSASVLVGGGVMFGLAPSGAPAPVAAAGAGAYDVDPVHSAMVYKISHNSGTFFGRFDKITGKFLLDAADLAGSKMEFTVDVNSVSTGAEKRDQHLRSPDFFNVKQFPTSTFKSTSVKKTGDASYEVAGDLTICGLTKPVTVKVMSVKSGKNPMDTSKENAGFEATFSVKRSDFGMTKFEGMLGNDVTVMVGVEGNR